MRTSDVNDAPIGISRRKAIKAVAAAMVSAGLLAAQTNGTSAAQATPPPKEKPKKKESEKQRTELLKRKPWRFSPTDCSNTEDHAGTVAILLAVTKVYCDTGFYVWKTDPPTAPTDDEIAKLAKDMGFGDAMKFPNATKAITNLLASLQGGLANPPKTMRGVYDIFYGHLMALNHDLGNNTYGDDCPRFYSTIQNIAKV